MTEPKILHDRICEADDGGTANMVHDWALTKHTLVRKYAGISGGPRKKFAKSGAAYLDPFCATGRSYIMETRDFTPGSPLHAWLESSERKSPFHQVLIGDVDAESLDQCHYRLKQAEAPVTGFLGKAEDTITQMIAAINPYGLHFALLDPYNLAAMPFSIIEKLCEIKRMDILIHVSTQDLQRNFGNFQRKNPEILEAFAPGWRNHIDLNQTEASCRESYFQYWCSLIEKAGKRACDRVIHMKTAGNNTLYYLVMVSAHDLGHKFWDIVSKDEKQPGLFD